MVRPPIVYQPITNSYPWLTRISPGAHALSRLIQRTGVLPLVLPVLVPLHGADQHEQWCIETDGMTDRLGQVGKARLPGFLVGHSP